MARIKPFRAIRPITAYAPLVAALPYDVYSIEEARSTVKNNSCSFLHVDKAEIDLPDTVPPLDPCIYEKAKENLNDLKEKGILFADQEKNLYIYRLTREGRTQTGLVCLTSIDEYLQGTIKKHELTRQEKEQDRIYHIMTLNANTGPIFMAYPKKKEISLQISQWVSSHQPIYDFSKEEDGVLHQIYLVDSPEAKEALCRAFLEVPALYIADGHHRMAAAARVGEMLREKKKESPWEAGYLYTLSVLFPAEELYIMDYNRLVKDLNGHTREEFLQALWGKFFVSPCTMEDARPLERGCFGMYLCGQWYSLRAKKPYGEDLMSALDVSILEREILNPILGITDVRTDKKIDFVGGVRGLAALQERVDTGEMAVAFSMYPTAIADLLGIADAGQIMPPKSTWFEPKLLSGLFIHDLSEEE